jgi:hypothetical protein
MEQKFTIRPKIQEGESFSGYLMKVAEMNSVKFGSVRKYLGIDGNYVYPLDILPQKIVNISSLTNLLGIDEESVLKMTFWNLFNKFCSNIVFETNEFNSDISVEFERRERRFCVSCLREHSYYKLLWQVKEVCICDIHFTKLQSICSSCGTKQPFISSTLGKLLCFKCGNDISKQLEEKVSDKNYIKEQLRIIEDWLFLLNKKPLLSSHYNEYGKEKFLTIISLYISQMMEDEFKLDNISFFNITDIRRYIKFINNLEGGKSIKFNKFLKLARNFNINLNTIFSINVPEAYIISLCGYKYKNKRVGVCLSHWCTNYNSASSMVTINSYKFNTYHYLSCVCTKCFNKYGYNLKTHKWENIDGFIDLLSNKILPSLHLGISLEEILLKYKIKEAKLINAIAYSANYKLLDKEFMEKYTIKSIPDNIKDCFTYLYNLKGSMRKNSKKYFGWNANEYYYFLNLKEIQYFLIFNKKMFLNRSYNDRNGKKEQLKEDLEKLFKYYINTDKDINVINITKDLNHPHYKIYRSGLNGEIKKAVKKQQEIRKVHKKDFLIDKVKEYFKQKEVADNLLTCNDVYKDLELNRNVLRKEMAEVKKLIKYKVDNYNKKVFNYRTKNLIKKTAEIVEEFSRVGENATHENIAFRLGISLSTLRRNVELKKAIGYIINRYYL